MSCILRILKCNFYLIIVIDITSNKDIQITIFISFNRYNIFIKRLTVNSYRNSTIVINQSRCRSSFHQVFHIGEATKVNTNHVSTRSKFNCAQGVRTTQISSKLNVIKIEVNTTITRCSICITQVESNTLEIINSNFTRPSKVSPFGSNTKFINHATFPLTWLSLSTGSNVCGLISLNRHLQLPLSSLRHHFVSLDIELSMPCLSRRIKSSYLKASATINTFTFNDFWFIGSRVAIVRTIQRNRET